MGAWKCARMNTYPSRCIMGNSKKLSRQNVPALCTSPRGLSYHARVRFQKKDAVRSLEHQGILYTLQVRWLGFSCSSCVSQAFWEALLSLMLAVPPQWSPSTFCSRKDTAWNFRCQQGRHSNEPVSPC
jgi:hypothetical protein